MPSPVRQTYRKGNALMKSLISPLLLAALLASAGFSGVAQAADDYPCMMGGAGPMQGDMGYGHMGQRDGSRMQAYMDRRHAALKAQLKLTPAQESAWTSYTAAMKPPADLMKQHQADYTELAKLSTPERIDKMKSMRSQHMNDMSAAMDQRGDAIKAFYATLTPAQQKVFDTHTMRPQGKGRHMGGQMEGRMGMDGKAPAPPAKP